MTKKNKIIKIIVIAVIALVLLYNIVWLVFYFKCHGYEKSIGYDNDMQGYVYTDDNFCYSAAMPGYLRFDNFNLSVTQVRESDENGEPKDKYYTDLLIFKKFFGETEYVVQITCYDPKKGDLSCSISLDKQGNPINSLSDEEQTAFNDCSETITELYKNAENMWGTL